MAAPSRWLEAGVIRPGAASLPLEARLSELYDSLTEVLVQFRPDALSLEEVFSQHRFPTSALWMAHARGVVCLAAARAGVPVHSYAPTSVKLALVGNGHASKEQVQHMVARRLGLARVPSPLDATDAWPLPSRIWTPCIRRWRHRMFPRPLGEDEGGAAFHPHSNSPPSRGRGLWRPSFGIRKLFPLPLGEPACRKAGVRVRVVHPFTPTLTLLQRGGRIRVRT